MIGRSNVIYVVYHSHETVLCTLTRKSTATTSLSPVMDAIWSFERLATWKPTKRTRIVVLMKRISTKTNFDAIICQIVLIVVNLKSFTVFFTQIFPKIFAVLKIPQKNTIKFAVEKNLKFFCISYANICGNIFARINIRNYLRKIFEKFIFSLIFA